jgi:hypothetical protein
VEWVIVPGEEPDRVESKGQCHAQRRDEDPPAQQGLTVSLLRAGESLFGQGNRLFVVQITDERNAAENDDQDTKDTEAGNESIHGSLQNKKRMRLYCISLIRSSLCPCRNRLIHPGL